MKDIKMVQMAQNVIKPLAILGFLILLSQLCFGQINKETIDKYIARNYKVPKSLNRNCNWEFLVLKIDLKNSNKITYIIENNVDSTLKKSIEFLKNYTVKKEEQKNFPILIFITIKNETGECGNDFIIPTPSEVTEKIIEYVINVQKKSPQVKIYPPITAVISQSRY